MLPNDKIPFMEVKIRQQIPDRDLNHGTHIRWEIRNKGAISVI